LQGKVKVGTCGFSKSRKQIYSELDIVEVQQTFYDPRNHQWLKKIKEEAPTSFEFTIKAWMLITHKYNPKLWKRLKTDIPYPKESFGDLRRNDAVCWAWSETMKAAEILNATIILVQSPPSFKPIRENIENIIDFFQNCNREGRIIAWEPRGKWWENTRLLESIHNDLNILIAGDPLRGRLPPEDQEILYGRLHGLGGTEVNYRYKYTDEDLERLVNIIVKIDKKENYILFNNIYSYQDAVRFKNILKRVRPNTK